MNKGFYVSSNKFIVAKVKYLENVPCWPYDYQSIPPVLPLNMICFMKMPFIRTFINSEGYSSISSGFK